MNIALVILLICVVLLISEYALRWKYPFAKNTWPTKFIPEMGWTFDPHNVVRCTNWNDFAVETKVNSIGFLDYDHDQRKPAGTIRILFLGDSYLEAAQVKISEKFHSLLEADLNNNDSSRRFETIAMGYSGCGTTDLLKYYQQFGKKYDPDIVVVIFSEFSFASNSHILQSLRNGWHPYHPPWPLFQKYENTFRSIPIDPNWNEYLLDSHGWLAKRPYSYWRTPKFLGLDRVRFVRWANSNLRDAVGSFLVQYDETYETKILERITKLKTLPEYRNILDEWQFPKDPAMDDMFFTTEMPSLFYEALDVTDYVFSLFRSIAETHSISLFIMATPRCSVPSSLSQHYDRSIVSGKYLDRLCSIANQHQIPVIDLGEYFNDKEKGTKGFTKDIHWNPIQHRIVANALLNYLLDTETGMVRTLQPTNRQ